VCSVMSRTRLTFLLFFIRSASKFASLFQTWAMDIKMCYDNACPLVHNQIDARTCSLCGSYFGSQSLLNNHKKLHKSTRRQSCRKASKVLAQKGNEILAMFSEDEFEWVAPEDIDLSQAVEIPATDDSDVMPVIASFKFHGSCYEN
jgi:hypothetical protein